MMGPVCIGCQYEIDPALGRKAKCPECGREYDLDVRETFGPRTVEVSRAGWDQTIFAIAVVFLLGVVVLGNLGMGMVGSLPIATLMGVGAFIECRRVWRSTCLVLVVLHLGVTAATAVRTAGSLSSAWVLHLFIAPLFYVVVLVAGVLIARTILGADGRERQRKSAE